MAEPTHYVHVLTRSGALVHSLPAFGVMDATSILLSDLKDMDASKYTVEVEDLQGGQADELPEDMAYCAG